MRELTELTYPVELRDEELDSVAAGCSSCGGGRGGDNTFQAGLVNVNDTNIGVAILSNQFQSVG
jgi:hypothetical protein